MVHKEFPERFSFKTLISIPCYFVYFFLFVPFLFYHGKRDIVIVDGYCDFTLVESLVGLYRGV